MAIDYNADVLPLYDTKLETNPEYVQELATVSSRGFADRDTTTIGASGDNFLLNTVSVIVGGTATLDDWLAAIVAVAPVTGGDLEAAIVQQADGDYVIAIAAVDDGTPVNIVLAAGTSNDGLPLLGLPAGTVVSGGDLGVGRADQKNEQRILTTLGVLVAHLRLLGDRDEARSLHFVLSRIATGVGSGGFVYSDTTSSVKGNVKNPQYVVNDDIAIEVVNPGEGVVVGAAFIAAAVTSTNNYNLDDIVVDINAAAGGAGLTVDDLLASNDGGVLKLHSENGHNINIQSGVAANDLVTNKSGLEYGLVAQSKRAEVADKVKAEALDYFNTERRALNL